MQTAIASEDCWKCLLAPVCDGASLGDKNCLRTALDEPERMHTGFVKQRINPIGELKNRKSTDILPDWPKK